tara:strand:- start:52 stop:462 length:411 start_codon:yes stop_codon:yes gene_type:complete
MTESYFVFKLVSGEEIVAVTEIDESGIEPSFLLKSPLKVELTHRGTNTLVRLIPWITIPEEDVYKIGFDKIITFTELEDDHEMINAYNHYNWQRKTKENHKIKLSEKMGYRGDVDDTRVSLEKLFTSDIIGITTTV